MGRYLSAVCALLLAPAMALLALSAPPGSLTGKVISIADGDTLTVLVGKESIRIRLEGIDAPESKQAFGNKAKQHLQSLVGTKEATVHPTGKDKYGRTLGEVFVDGVSLNQKMVEDGFAWHYKQYSTDAKLAKAESAAKSKKLGLWADPNPLAPWEFRKRQKQPADEVETQSTVPKKASSIAQPSNLKEAQPKQSSGAVYWLNTSSGVRHNEGCQYFMKTTRGRECSKDEGRPCGMCGG